MVYSLQSYPKRREFKTQTLRLILFTPNVMNNFAHQSRCELDHPRCELCVAGDLTKAGVDSPGPTVISVPGPGLGFISTQN